MADESRERRHRAHNVYDSEYHAPVLCKTVVEELVTDPGGVYVDATVGGGGHAAALLASLSAEARVVGLDRDTQAIETVEARLKSDIDNGRLLPVASTFGALEQVLDALGVTEVHGVLVDLGVSSHQIDMGARGFSYLREGPLDMRMDRTAELTADDVVNRWEERELLRALREFGEEPRAKKIVRAIVAHRPVQTTTELADLIRASVPTPLEIKSLSRVFQAIRIVVNDELAEIRKVLQASTRRVVPGGRLAVIAYHSLEDRLVKRFLRYGNFEGDPQRDTFGNLLAPWTPRNRKPILADDAEIDRNPRARSARLRVGERN